MGLFSSAGASKSDLIRLLLIERIKNDPEARAQGFSPLMVRQMPDSQVIQTVEAGVVYMVEMFEGLKRKGYIEQDALLLIEKHRKSLGYGELPNPLNISSFINYRAEIEHTGAALPPDHIDVCHQAADHFFTFLDDKGDAANSLKYALLEKTTRKLEHVMTAVANYANGETTETEFYESLEADVLDWMIELTERKQRADTFRLKAQLRDMQ